MTDTLGAFGEKYAVGYLKRLGYEIVERNVRFRAGEIDIVAREGADVVFVEVKCRRSSQYGSPEHAITPAKYAHLATAIEEYVASDRVPCDNYRIDVVAIEVDARGRVSRCDVLRGVEAPGF